MLVLSGPERRRRWSTAEKLAIIQETYEPNATVSIVARRHDIQLHNFSALSISRRYQQLHHSEARAEAGVNVA